MPQRVPRRRFLLETAGYSLLLSLPGCSRGRTAGPLAAPADGWTGAAADLELLARDLTERYQVPGISLAVVRDAALVWSRGLGVRDRDSGAPVTPDTVFEAASMSKPVFAYAVMQLVERGVIDLDTPLTSYARDAFLEGDPRLDLVTARHVLSHTSGFQDIRSRQDPLRIHFTPGEKWQYSGEGYAYLQSVLTRLAGRALSAPCGTYEMDLPMCGTDFDAYMQTRVLRPLGMTSSGYLWRDALAPVAARPHDDRGEPLPIRRPNEADAARYGAMGGLLTTAPDYARFLVAILAPPPADGMHLRKATIESMLAPQVHVENGPGHSIDWALGWKVATATEFGVLVSHGGDQSGFHSLAEMSPGLRSGYVILTNGDSGWKLIQELAPVMARRVYG